MYTSDALPRLLQDQRCVEQFDRMRSLGLVPDLGTVNLVLTGLCCRGRLGEAVELLGNLRSQMGLRPNSYSVLMVLQVGLSATERNMGNTRWVTEPTTHVARKFPNAAIC